MKSSFTMAALTLATLYGAGAMAQNTTPSTSTPGADVTQSTPAESSVTPSADATTSPAPATAVAVSETKLNQFADAYVAIAEIQSEAKTDRTEGAENPEALKAREAALQTKMQTAIEKSGMQIEEFNQIAQQSMTDLDLRAKLAEKVQARNGDRAGG